MDFRDKYTTNVADVTKTPVSNEAFLFAELITELKKSIDMLRSKL